MEHKVKVNELPRIINKLKCKDTVYLSGTVYTARDAAHKKLLELINNNEALPFSLENAVIYYAGPTSTPENLVIGSCGPTTSKRMDEFTPILYDKGVIATIGKGERNQDVLNGIVKNNGVYFCAVGGAGAIAAKHIIKNEVIAFNELGCESIKKLEFKDFPLIVGIDCHGNDIFAK